MKRRLFFRLIPTFSILFLKIQNVFARLFFSDFNFSQKNINVSDLTLYTSPTSSVKIPIWYHQHTAYVSSDQFAKVLNHQTYFNNKKRKLVIYLPNNQVVLSAQNAFVIIDNHVLQMPATTIWHRNEIYVPLKYFLPLLHRKTTLQFDYDASQQILRINASDFNINDLTISKKQNGTVIRIRTLNDFLDDEITADMRNGWLHIDFYGGKVDSKRVKESKTDGLVRRINTFQFPELASIAFYLKQEPLSRELINNSENNEVLLVLRTKEEVGEEELPELSKGDAVKKNDDLMRQLDEERHKWLVDVVVIDPGHGGKDPGTVGANKTYEKDIVLAIALKLGDIIKKEMPDIKVVYTRNKDEFIELRRRTAIANQNKGKVFISIHANASPQTRVRGFETYFLGTEKGERAREVVLQENSVIEFEDSASQKQYENIKSFILANMLQQTNMKHSELLASLVQNNLFSELQSINMFNRGVKQGPFLVMVRATMPNILIEAGFISNSNDMRILKTGKYQRKIAQGIFQGLKEYKRDIENAI